MAARKNIFVFNGTKSQTGDTYSGFIFAGDLADGFDESTWILNYQRDRVTKKEKVSELLGKFQEHGKLPGIVLNLVGEVYPQASGGYLLKGHFHVVDGQQRLRALIQSGVRDYEVTVQVYDNISYEEEKGYFLEINRKQTRLGTGDSTKALNGPMAEGVIQKALNTPNYPVKLHTQRWDRGVTIPTLNSLAYWTNRFVNHGRRLKSASGGDDVEFFLQNPEYSKAEVQLTDRALRNLLKEYVLLFGPWEPKVDAYRRTFILSWNHFVINNFMTTDGDIDWRGKKYSKKIDGRYKVLNSAKIKQVLKSGGTGHALEVIYDQIVDHFNYAMKGGLLEKLDQIELDVAGLDEDAPVPVIPKRKTTQASLRT